MKNAIFIFLAGVFFLNGCAVQFYREEFQIDPDVRKVVLFNDSPYVLEERGIFNAQIDPGGRAETNVDCYKTLKGLVTAYKRIGKNKAGEKIYETFGQRWYTVTVDGRNDYVNGVDTDGYVKFAEGSFSPSQLKNGKDYYIQLTGNPCSVVR